MGKGSIPFFLLGGANAGRKALNYGI